MPEVRYQTNIGVSRDRLWEFVRDIDNWAPMMTGYVSHEVRDDRVSLWTLKGDVGILSRTVRLEVTILEWAGPDRVRFALRGLNEAVEGGGSFELADTGIGRAELPERRRTLVERFLAWVGRLWFRWQHGGGPGPAPPSAGGTSLTFTWRMEASGPTAPLVNVLLEPALEPAAEALARRIAAHLLGHPTSERR